MNQTVICIPWLVRSTIVDSVSVQSLKVPRKYFSWANQSAESPGGNSLYFVWYRRAAGIAPIFQVIFTSIGHDFISNIHLQPSIQSLAVLSLTTWPLSLQVILLLSDKNQFRIQHLNVLMIFCIKKLNLNGNKEHFLLSSMMVYTFIGILFPYSSKHL